MEVTDFRHRFPMSVRWGDLDAYGHVNNVNYFRFLESARVAYMTEGLGLTIRAEGENIILADAQCRFISQLTFPQELEIFTRISRVGRSSLITDQIILRAGESAPAAQATCVLVWFDFERQLSSPLPSELRERLAQYEHIMPEGVLMR
ncbi:MAG: thioesterase family protein [Pseudomonadota bacterium]|nr:thioesterase family protein [Pseudomonadota bacterium]